MHSNRYTIIFSLVICVSCSLLLAVAAESLKPRIQQNKALEKQKNILRASGLLKPGKSYTASDLQTLYKERITENVIDENGNIVPGKKPADLDPKVDTNLFPLYLRKDNGKITACCFPISGKGLWSTIYGYMALESDCDTVKGVTFYQHGETPGLGGEIEKSWFSDNFKGKKIFDSQGKLTPIQIVKGKIPSTMPETEKIHKVDGISGATLTGRGVTLFIARDLKKYLPYFKQIREHGFQS